MLEFRCGWVGVVSVLQAEVKLVFWSFDQVGYGISASECYINVCVSEYVFKRPQHSAPLQMGNLPTDMEHMQPVVCRPNEPSLNICFQEPIRYIRNNNPQSAYAQHTRIIQNQHEYGQMNSKMTLLKPLNNPSLLIPYEQYYIQTLYWESKLILGQIPGEINPLFQTVINP